MLQFGRKGGISIIIIILGVGISMSAQVPLFFSNAGGYYDVGKLQLTLSTPVTGTRILYSTDGSNPSIKGRIYQDPIVLRRNTVIQACLIDANNKVLAQRTETYFIQEPRRNFPVVCVTMDPEILFNVDHGIFKAGPHAQKAQWKMPGANFWTEEEFPAHAVIYDAKGGETFHGMCGFRLFGGLSRIFPQKSFSLSFRKQYNQNRISADLFQSGTTKEYKHIVLRNAGSDFGKAHIRDALISTLVKDENIEVQDYAPSIVYLNGKYWGLYHLREKTNRYFLEQQTGIPRDSINLLRHKEDVIKGTDVSYQKLLDILATQDILNPEVQEQIESRMDVQNFLLYKSIQIYIDNIDAGGNIKYWKPDTDPGRWRWILFDTDYGFGLHDPLAYQNNSIAFHLESGKDQWPNPDWSTFILRTLIRNPAWKDQLINLLADLMNTAFQPENIKNTLDTLILPIHDEMIRHLHRWNLSEKKWHEELNVIKNFSDKRPAWMQQYLQFTLQAGKPKNVYLIVLGNGTVILNDHIQVNNTFKGVYFTNTKIKLHAKPKPGFRFAGWNVSNTSHSSTLVQNPGIQDTLIAQFEKIQQPLQEQIIINEVNAMDGVAGDWIELYNPTPKTISLEHWTCMDDRNTFVLPPYQLEAGGYAVLIRNPDAFQRQFPWVTNIAGIIPFGINRGGECIQLYHSGGAIMDSVAYVGHVWDTAHTYALLIPDAKHRGPDLWHDDPGIGTPGGANTFYLQSKVHALQQQWTILGLIGGILALGLWLLYFQRKK